MLMALVVSAVTSCIYEYENEPAKPEGVSLKISLDVSPLTMSGSDIGNDHEKVQSIRIIMLSDGRLEVNERTTLNSVLASQLKKSYRFNTVPGEKEFYIIANEESVSDYSFESGSGVNVDTSRDFSELLTSFKPEAEGNTANGKALKAVLENLYFEPTFSQNQNDDIYLPYTAHYSGYRIEDEDQTYLQDPVRMYLVPVATKFIFTFVNYRPNEVQINEVTVNDKNDSHFLMGHVLESHKYFGSDYLYWVDWLARVSEESHNHIEPGDNEDFNKDFGWINNYEIPTESNTSPMQFVRPVDGESVAAATPIEGKENEYTPKTTVLGPFYVPESWNEYSYYDNKLEDWVTEQRYYLTLGLHDVKSEPGKDPGFDKVEIGNLRALFRNTCMLIKVIFYEGKVEIYAEMSDWNHSYAQGYVITTKPT